VKFANCRVGDADFEGAILLDCDFCGADLTFVRNLTQEQFRYCYTDAATRLPEGLTHNEGKYFRKAIASSSSSSTGMAAAALPSPAQPGPPDPPSQPARPRAPRDPE
jgi:hypothetical protein